MSGKCNVCGNDYHRPLEITLGGQRHTFDCFECAIHMLAPTCMNCGVRVIGHGLEDADGSVYCCASCVEHAGVDPAKARA